jgi:hypothetical protein
LILKIVCLLDLAEISDKYYMSNIKKALGNWQIQ